MQLTPEHNCPLNGFQPCKKLECAWFVHLRGQHPQTGADIDEYSCAISWLPVLLVETAKEVRQGAAATETMRNEIARAGERIAMASSLKAVGA